MGRQIRKNLVGRAERGNQFDQPEVLAGLPFVGPQLVGAGHQALLRFVRDEGPEGHGRRTVGTVPDPELLQQDGWHGEPFQVADEQLLVQRRLGQQPGDLA